MRAARGCDSGRDRAALDPRVGARGEGRVAADGAAVCRPRLTGRGRTRVGVGERRCGA